MRAAAWSLLLAGGAVAAPGIPAAGYGYNHGADDYPPKSSSSSCTESQTAPHAYASSSTSSSSSTTATIPAYPHSYPSNNTALHSFTKPVYVHPSASLPVSDETTTVLTTVYTTYCPTTAVTYVEQGTTKITSYVLTTPTGSPAQPPASVSNVEQPHTTVTSYTSAYETQCTATTTEVHEGQTYTKTYDTVSTITTVYASTITEGNGGNGGPGGYITPVSWTTATIPWGTDILTYTAPIAPPNPSSTPDSYPSESNPGYPGGYPSGSAPGSYPTQSYPAGNNTKTYPWGTGTATGTYTHTSTSTTHSAKPTQTEACVPCKGQPGNNPDEFCGYTINDNWYEVMPTTCRTVEYHFTVANQTISPDGIERIGLVVNGQMPGPKIEANWGDTIVVHLTNQLQNNGTSLHFHGVRMNFTNEFDGVPSITQCALAPGESMTYTFKATNYGSSWWHSHFAIQTYEGVFGPMVIHGPAAAEYDEEEFIAIQDWSHVTADSLYQSAQTVGPAPDHGPRTLDTGLINGKNVWGVDGAANATGERYVMRVQYGKKYRIRLVNTAIQSTFKFYVDGHKFTVIANDFVPIHPYETNIVNINIGQRYDLIMKADQTPGNYWMRADNQNACAQITKATNIKGIVTYFGALPLASSLTPTSTAYNYTGECVDEPLASLVPIVPLNVGEQDDTIQKTVVVGANGGTPNLFKWTLSGTTFQSQWGDATLSSINKNGSVPNYSGNLAIEVKNLKEWVYVIIDSPIPLPHPIHLHGHDVFVLAQGKGLYSSDVVLNTVNPPRRDVVTMPWDPVNKAGGHLVLAFQSDNPGVWLMHCHIGWHVSMGFALQIIENVDSIKDTISNPKQLEDTCSSWNTYADSNGIKVDDSGV